MLPRYRGPVKARLSTRPATILAMLTVRDWGGGFLLYGLVIVLQGPGRWSGPQFVTAVDIAPSFVWGSVFAVLGLLILVGHFNYWFLVRNIGLYGAMVMVICLGLTTLREATRNDHVSFAGAVFCGMVAGALLIVARSREVRPDAGIS